MALPVVVVIRNNRVVQALASSGMDDAERLFKQLVESHGIDATQAQIRQGFLVSGDSTISLVKPTSDLDDRIYLAVRNRETDLSDLLGFASLAEVLEWGRQNRGDLYWDAKVWTPERHQLLYSALFTEFGKYQQWAGRRTPNGTGSSHELEDFMRKLLPKIAQLPGASPKSHRAIHQQMEWAVTTQTTINDKGTWLRNVLAAIENGFYSTPPVASDAN